MLVCHRSLAVLLLWLARAKKKAARQQFF